MDEWEYVCPFLYRWSLYVELKCMLIMVDVWQVPQTHRHLPPRISIHLRVLDPLRGKVPSSASAASISFE